MTSMLFSELMNCAWTLWRNGVITKEEYQKICNNIALKNKENPNDQPRDTGSAEKD